MPQLDQDYLFLPHRLIADLQANPAAIGVYALIARLFLIYQEPIPLSAADLQRYDPSLSYGAARGALQRLTALHWLDERSGHKNCYTPAWGVIKGSIRPWQMDAPTLGRPAHLTTMRLDRRLLDVGMGKLAPHQTYPAQTDERYLERPILSLRDVGAYAQALRGRSIAATAALLRYGLIRDGQAQPLPSAESLIALASQRTLTADGAAPTEHGLRKLGLERSVAPPETPQGQPLFFVEHDLIPDPITCSIPDLIPQVAKSQGRSSAADGPRSRISVHSLHMAGTPGTPRETRDPPPTPPIASGDGGEDRRLEKRADREALRPETESAELLRSINAFPSSIAELANMPAELVREAIAYAEAEPGIESVAGWVVEALRRNRDEGWAIPSPRTRWPDPASRQRLLDVEAYTSGAYGDLFRLGGDTSDLEDARLVAEQRELVSQDARAEGHTPVERYVQSEGFAPASGAIDDQHAPAGPGLRTEAADAALTRSLQEELRVRAGRQYRPVIAGLHLHLAGGATLIICATFADLAVVQHELIGAIRGILGSLGAPPQLVFTTRAGWEARRGAAGNTRSRPPALSGALSTA